MERQKVRGKNVTSRPQKIANNVSQGVGNILSFGSTNSGLGVVVRDSRGKGMIA